MLGPMALPPVPPSWLAPLLLLQVWGDRGPREVLAVESSGAMCRLASRVWDNPAVRAAVAPLEAAPRVRWMSRLPRESGDAPKRWVQLRPVVCLKHRNSQCGPRRGQSDVAGEIQ